MLDVFERKRHILGVLFEERIKRRYSELGSDKAAREYRLHFGCKDKTSRKSGEIERLYPETIPTREQQPLCLVVEQKRELASKMIEKVEPEFLVQIDDDL